MNSGSDALFLYIKLMDFDAESRKTNLGALYHLSDCPGPFENCHQQSRSHRTLNQ